ncbi:MAG: serine hydrolase [Candidatus Pacebacteria bacterium]|nr:serine hydrolase [Candidatus Paceibacterota bacterium]
MPRNNSNRLSFLFTGILMLSVLFFRTDSDAKNNLSYQENIKNTSLTASAQAVAFNQPASAIKTQLPIVPQEIISTVNIQPALIEKQQPVKNIGVINPAIGAKIVFAKDLESGEILFAKGEDKYWPAASITKLMTALVALDKIGTEKVVEISQHAMDIDDSKSGNFSAGEKYYVRDLTRIMLLISSNKAAEAIAEFYGRENFINEMNSIAGKLGISRKFYDCTGLSMLNQFTADDLAKLAEYILLKKPEIFEYTTIKEMSFIELSTNTAKFFANINIFAGREDFLGGKTGFIESSEQNLLSLFSHKGRKILLIILGSEDRFSDTGTLLEWIKNSYEF